MKKIFLIFMVMMIVVPAWCQKSADEYLRNAPIFLSREVCTYTKEEFGIFTEHLKSYTDTLLQDIEQRRENAKIVDLSPANYQKAMEITGKITDYSTAYFGKYYCLTLLCKDYPELLSGDEIARATGFSEKYKELIQFRSDVVSGKAKESDRPDWHKQMTEAQNGFCHIMGPKYLMVLENDLTDLKRLIPDCRTLGSLYFTGTPGASEIEALSAVHNYLEKFRTNSFLGNLKMVFADF